LIAVTMRLAADPPPSPPILARIIFDGAAKLAECGTGVTEVVQLVRAKSCDRAGIWR